MTKTINVRIDKLAYGGDGLGKLPDGKVVFVPYTIPGENVRVRLVEEKSHHARAELVEVLEGSSKREAARCQHFMTCGGCHYQHMTYPAQAAAKTGILMEQLERIGGFKDIPAIETHEAPEAWYYRNHIQFHLSDKGKLGFKEARSKHTFTLRECHLPEAALNQLWPKIEIESIPSLKRVSIRQGMDENLMLILESSDPLPLEFRVEDLTISVVQVRRGESLILAGSDHLPMEVLGRRFRVSPTSFFQVNTVQAEAMVGYLLENLPLKPGMTVLDLYAGVGLFSTLIAPRVNRLVSVEVSPEACHDFTTNLDEFNNVDLYEASTEEVLAGMRFNPDLIIMDPPRAGLGKHTIEGLLSQGADQLAYISCDPSTLGRDGKQLASGGYALVKLCLFDMFPQTYHIESISFWEKT